MKSDSLAWALYLLPLPLLALSLFVGPAEAVSPGAALAWLARRLGLLTGSGPQDRLIAAVLLDVRLPRVLLCFLVGGALSMSGAALQAMFRNPLVSPYILGLSSGAAFGAACALSLSWLPLQPAAFACGLLAVGTSYFLARSKGQISVVSLILSGVIVTGMFTALLTVVQFWADPFKLQTIVHWTMGNLHNATWDKLNSAAPPVGLGVLALFLLRWRLNVLALGDEETRAVGLNPEREKLMILLPATLAASGSVAVAGVIGLVGLVTPHMVRMLLGPENRRLMPACFTFGGAFLLAVDDCSRALASFELPIGVFTTLVGAPFFILLLKRARLGWEA